MSNNLDFQFLEYLEPLKGVAQFKYGRDVYNMSDGLTYELDDLGHWFIILD